MCVYVFCFQCAIEEENFTIRPTPVQRNVFVQCNIDLQVHAKFTSRKQGLFDRNMLTWIFFALEIFPWSLIGTGNRKIKRSLTSRDFTSNASNTSRG